LLCAALALELAAGCAAGEAPEARAAREALNRGDIALALRRPAEAEAAYAEALALDPESGEALIGLARAQAARGESAAALERYAELAEHHPERFAELRDGEYCRAVLARSWDLLASGAAAGALELADLARAEGCPQPELVTLRTDAKVGLADERRVRGEISAAAELYREVAESDPARVEAWQAAGELLLASGQREDALELLSEALRHHPRDSGLKELMVDALAGTNGPGGGD
jgi:tetratricopeptide (TPR) repeat protein